ncbi:elongation factor P maturation arginine rhamnosyltransferase EarP [Pseudothauera hydrothermalis]|uniref:elongation factor P maturation arginine rhamnosyltransferase EarP n=1 Tax=Pseudothauera hydrothermalis TaxID=2184083 RepID=UPI000E08F3EE|nr:elongation factor P maturation arginine rhamnosyltransferase EarP [Pseudothauera hydrothermalis]
MIHPSALAAPDCEIFCQVVDNFGDIGVCWRLARDLASRGLAVRLWVDDWATLARLCPQAADETDGIKVAGVELRRWEAAFAPVEPARLVVEAFACELPAAHLAAMAEHRPKPVWINLEYLSAEDWVAGVHGMASPHPRLPLTKYFCVPGFDAASGGLPRGPGLIEARATFQANPDARKEFLSVHGGAPAADALVVSLFAYDHAQLAELLAVWCAGPRPMCLLVPEGRIVCDLAAALELPQLTVGDRVVRGALDLRVIPFTDQDGYDRLLWSCDLNFVRGEDSFVRAQWAACPLVWQSYRQADNAHHVKLEAFLRRYCAGLEPIAAQPLQAFWQAWNGMGGTEKGNPASPADCWPAFAEALPALSAHARRWAKTLSEIPDLADTLANYLKEALKC